ncbi:hypothetical protein Lesp02_26190 [Lentzea sp. NBRC 105346]|uniref:hypothetical protein n=1 Tax=Lentzea sp. NBRC 105346 TaxID=3032205 RepID=UPI0025548A9C|nr:hypothetical protein [Lentzea sp. NBRC 105346]GLZ30430.1 hypothetical protein Lesp02_26190 [Lentzea sp. NBRC 105346]
MTDNEIKRPVDLIGLLFGLGALFASAFILTDGAFSFDPRWVLAGLAMVIGLGLLVNSTRRRRK